MGFRFCKYLRYCEITAAMLFPNLEPSRSKHALRAAPHQENYELSSVLIIF